MHQKILVYSTQLMPTGGIESHIMQFVENMASQGADIYLVVSNFKMTTGDESALRKRCKRVYLNSSNVSGKKNALWLIKTAVKLLKYNFDALYTNGQGKSIIHFSKLIRKKKWVHHHHTAGDLEDQQTWDNDYINTLQSANEIISCSVKNASDMSRSLNREIKTIPCFSRSIGRQEDIAANDQKSLNFGYFGRLIPEKGIDILCRMSEDVDCQHITFHIWGSGENYPKAFFEKYPKLHYHGTFAGAEELKKVMNSIDAYLLLSTHPEGLPISLLEVMSAGIPWLATDQGGISDIALDVKSTRVVSRNCTYSEFKQAVLGLAADIKNGLITPDVQMKLYEEKFASSILTKRWNAILNKD